MENSVQNLHQDITTNKITLHTPVIGQLIFLSKPSADRKVVYRIQTISNTTIYHFFDCQTYVFGSTNRLKLYSEKFGIGYYYLENELYDENFTTDELLLAKTKYYEKLKMKKTTHITHQAVKINKPTQGNQQPPTNRSNTSQSTPPSIFVLGQTIHAKKQHELFVVSINKENRVDKTTFKKWNNICKANNGYYSSYLAQGAIPGFQFKTNNDRINFIEELHYNL